MAKQEILLESGTNEVEVAEFRIRSQSFGVNVAKIREFVPYEQLTVTKLPGKHHSLLGVFLLRNKSIPLIDLDLHLGLKGEKQGSRQVVVITDFNNMTNGFIIDSINRIHRLSWKDIQPLNEYLETNATSITGSIDIENREILVLDLERIIDDVFPESAMVSTEQNVLDKPKKEMREHAKLIIAEDSSTIRNLMIKMLSSVGYKNITAFENGKDAYDAFVRLKSQIDSEGKSAKDMVDFIVLDIEMPQMDGLTLCKHIKTGLGFSNVPVLMFSSLINEQMARKCEKMGANAYITKPNINKLVDIADEWCFGDKKSDE